VPGPATKSLHHQPAAGNRRDRRDDSPARPRDAGLPFTPRLPLVALMIAAGFLGTLDQAIPTIVALDLVLRSA
jgi:hypothetical protein